MATQIDNEKSLETIKILVHSSVLTDQYKLKRIKEIIGAPNIKVLTKEK